MDFTNGGSKIISSTISVCSDIKYCDLHVQSISRYSLQTGLTSLFGFSNLYLLKQSTDYFGQETELNVFTHTWSLGVEEQFYFVFPFLIWFLVLEDRRRMELSSIYDSFIINNYFANWIYLLYQCTYHRHIS